MNIDKEQLCYIAGFIDGEGCFLINKRRHQGYKNSSYIGYSAYIDIGNTNKKVLEWIKSIVGVTSNIYENKSKGNRKMAYRLRICYSQSFELTKLLLPYLIVKKEVASLFIEYKNAKNKELLFNKVKKLNFRGLLKV